MAADEPQRAQDRFRGIWSLLKKLANATATVRTLVGTVVLLIGLAVGLLTARDTPADCGDPNTGEYVDGWQSGPNIECIAVKQRTPEHWSLLVRPKLGGSKGSDSGTVWHRLQAPLDLNAKSIEVQLKFAKGSLPP